MTFTTNTSLRMQLKGGVLLDMVLSVCFSMKDFLGKNFIFLGILSYYGSLDTNDKRTLSP